MKQYNTPNKTEVSRDKKLKEKVLLSLGACAMAFTASFACSGEKTDYSEDKPHPVYIRDDNGKFIGVEWRAAENNQIVSQESYDADLNLIRIDNFNADGNLEDYRLFEYNADGNRIKREDYDADGNLLAYFIHEYDDEGNRIKTECYDADGNPID